MKGTEIKLDLVITNPDSVLETAKRLDEIAKELAVIGYKLQAKLGGKEMEAMLEEKKIKIHCECGRDEHYEGAKYCVDCGKQLEGAAATTPSGEDHL